MQTQCAGKLEVVRHFPELGCRNDRLQFRAAVDCGVIGLTLAFYSFESIHGRCGQTRLLMSVEDIETFLNGPLID